MEIPKDIKAVLAVITNNEKKIPELEDRLEHLIAQRPAVAFSKVKQNRDVLEQRIRDVSKEVEEMKLQNEGAKQKVVRLINEWKEQRRQKLYKEADELEEQAQQAEKQTNELVKKLIEINGPLRVFYSNAGGEAKKLRQSAKYLRRSELSYEEQWMIDKVKKIAGIGRD